MNGREVHAACYKWKIGICLTQKIHAYICIQRYLRNYKKLLSNLMKRCDASLEYPSDSKNYYGFVADDFSKFVHTTNLQGFAFIRLPISNARQSKLFTECPQKVQLKRIGSIRCLVGNVKQLFKLFWIVVEEFSGMLRNFDCQHFVCLRP